RTWFVANKETYEGKVRGPMVALVTALSGAMHGFAPEMITDPKRAIHRTHRYRPFTRNKRPYKTHIPGTFSPLGLPKPPSAGSYSMPSSLWCRSSVSCTRPCAPRRPPGRGRDDATAPVHETRLDGRRRLRPRCPPRATLPRGRDRSYRPRQLRPRVGPRVPEA